MRRWKVGERTVCRVCGAPLVVVSDPRIVSLSAGMLVHCTKRGRPKRSRHRAVPW